MTDNIEEKLARFRKTKPMIAEEKKSSGSVSSISERFRSIFASSSSSSSSDSRNQQGKVVIEARDQEITAETAEVEEPFRIRMIKHVLYFLLWAILYVIFIKLEFGVVYFVVSLLVLIYFNTGRRKPGTKSAYSVFNPNVERIQGQLTAEQLQQNLLRPF